MTKQDVLKSIGRPGWVVTGERDELEDAFDAKGQPLGKKPSGNKIWSIASADGSQTDVITVKPAPYTGEFETAPNGDRVRATEYTVLQGPSHEVPVSSSATSATQQNEAALNDERSWNAQNTKWGRVTHAEKQALELREQTEQRQLTNQERDDVLARAREDRAVQAEGRVAANQAASNDIARARLALDQQKAAQGDVQVVATPDGGKKIVRISPDNTVQELFAFPPGIQIEKSNDGTIIAIDPSNPTNTQVIWRPEKPPELVPGQSATQGRLLQRDPRTGDLTAVPNPLGNAAQQRWQDLQDGIDTVHGMLTRGELSVEDANKYTQALRQNFDAALQGTTPYQQFQDRQARQQARMQSGAGLLNQRVSSGSGLAESLLSSAVGIVGNKNFMDPSAVAGFSPFSGAMDYVTSLGGGPDVYSGAADAVRQGLSGDDPASALLNVALNGSAPAAGPAADTATPPAAPGFGGGPYQGALNPNVFGSGMGDPASALLAAAIGGGYRQPQQYDPALRQRGALFG